MTCLNFCSDILPTDGGLVLKGIARAIIPEVTEDQEGESSAGQEPNATSAPPVHPHIQGESTSL